MSEFCEHVEQAIGWAKISYADSKELHAQGCGICDEIRSLVRTLGVTPAEAERFILGRNVAHIEPEQVRSRIDRLLAFFGRAR